ncbi:hypothetical protein GPL15_04295 [Clostridium sp. MCC353]|uniref:leucine-rich repeat domain-containing protein n=1 Tax=Clostridium sp. MCC353 TaxID=2592646 RepID=UPI001C01D31F|nr:leucine-rich repeat domain-containing protein [Clostridium sp. MCC353]MBT9775731.1 hypothetical protein [Clostridium sp. MCC353]
MKRKLAQILIGLSIVITMSSCNNGSKGQESQPQTAISQSETTTEETGQAVQWEDPAVEKLIREFLEKPEGDISISDLDFITSVDLYGDDRLFINGKDKDGAGFMENREQLAIRYYYDETLAGTIKTPADFKNFHQLKELGIYGSAITDASGFQEIVWLERLWLWNNKLTDINGIEKLTQLTSLDLSQNDLDDISPLKTMTGLKELWLWGNPIEDLEPLKDLTGLTTLMIQQTPVLDISPLAGMTKLKILDISETAVSDLSALKNMKDLEYLFALKTEVEDWSVADGMDGLNIKR